MNRSLVFRTFLFCLILMAGLTATQAQGENLLTNPGFENPFVAVEDGGASMIAEGWTPWSLQFDQYVMPEYYLASDTVNGMAPPRILSGEDAQQYFTFFAPHIAGVYQQVSGLEVGDQLSFSINAYVWSSSGDNSDVSDGSGDIVVEVGIDPNGGTDPASESIVWSDPIASYDRYEQYTVSAVAAGDTATAFVRSTVNQVAMNNVVYLDDASLVVTGQAEGSATEVVTVEMIAEVPVEVTEAPVEITPVVEMPTEAVTEVVTEAPMEVPTEAMTEEAATPDLAVSTEETLIVVTVEVTDVATESATETPTEVPTDVPTETPTDIPTVVVPTEVIPTDVPTDSAPTEVPTDAPPTSTPFPTSTLDTVAFPFIVSYTVVRGDTVGALATRYGSTVEAIIIANQLGSDARIFETQQLFIPVPVLPTATSIPSETPIPSATSIPSETPFPTFTQFPTFTLSPTVPPTPSETPIPVVPVEQGVAEMPIVVAQTYTVQYRDSLSAIAQRFGVDVRDLARINNIVNPNVIFVGQVLLIPASGVPTAMPSVTPVPSATNIPPTPTLVNPQIYQVQPGDNLYRISIRFNVPISTLIEVNGILNASRIFVGQLLIIPQ